MIVGEICSVQNYKKKFIINKNLYYNIADKYGPFVFINCHYLVDKENISLNSQLKRDKKFIFFHPKSYSELKKFLNDNQLFLINNLSLKLYHLKIYLSLNKTNIYQIEIDNLGIFSDYKLENWDAVNLKKKIYFLYLKKFAYLIYKFLFLIKAIKTKDRLYISRKDIYKRYLNNINQNIFFKPIYKKVIPTKLKSQSFIKSKLSEKFIVYLDQNINHKDILSRGIKINLKQEIFFFKSLLKYLKNMKKTFKKDVIICLHPTSNEKKYKKYLKGIKLVKNQTEKFIDEAFIVLFHSSSSVMRAFLNKKRIINLQAFSMGRLSNLRRFLYLKRFDLLQNDLEKDQVNFNKKEIIKLLDKNSVSYFNELKNKFFIENKYQNIEKLILENINDLIKNR